MFSEQTRQALRVLRWRAADNVEDVVRRVRPEKLTIKIVSGGQRPAPLNGVQMDHLLEKTSTGHDMRQVRR